MEARKYIGRNKLDGDYSRNASQDVESGQEETVIHGKKLAMELRGADSVSTIQAGDNTNIHLKVEASSTATDIQIINLGLQVTDDKVVNVASRPPFNSYSRR